MLKIAKAQTRIYKQFASVFLSMSKSGATQASLELLIRQSFQRSPINPGYVTCPHRKIRFHLDRRGALYDWLWGQGSDAVMPGVFYVSVMSWGDTYLYSYQRAEDSTEVYRLDDILSELTWYHSSKTVPYYSAPNVKVGVS